MSPFQEIKLHVPVLTTGDILQKGLPITGYVLSCEFDDIPGRYRGMNAVVTGAGVPLFRTGLVPQICQMCIEFPPELCHILVLLGWEVVQAGLDADN